jgi:serine protease Do
MRVSKLMVAGVLTMAGVGAAYVLAAPASGQSVVIRRQAPHPPASDEDRRDGEIRIAAGGPRIGARVRDVDAADVSREKLETRHGAVVTDVESDGPAAQAGLRAGDVLLRFDGEAVRSSRQLTRLVRESPDGKVDVEISRGGQRTTLQIAPSVGEHRETFQWDTHDAPGQFLPRLPDLDFDSLVPDVDIDVFRRTARLGVEVQGLSPQLARHFGVESGVLVFEVADDSPAAKAGLRAGDVILSVNGSSIDSASTLRRALRSIDEGVATIEVMRDRARQTFQVQLPASGRRLSTRRVI